MLDVKRLFGFKLTLCHNKLECSTMATIFSFDQSRLVWPERKRRRNTHSIAKKIRGRKSFITFARLANFCNFFVPENVEASTGPFELHQKEVKLRKNYIF